MRAGTIGSMQIRFEDSSSFSHGYPSWCLSDVFWGWGPGEGSAALERTLGSNLMGDSIRFDPKSGALRFIAVEIFPSEEFAVDVLHLPPPSQPRLARLDFQGFLSDEYVTNSFDDFVGWDPGRDLLLSTSRHFNGDRLLVAPDFSLLFSAGTYSGWALENATSHLFAPMDTTWTTPASPLVCRALSFWFSISTGERLNWGPVNTEEEREGRRLARDLLVEGHPRAARLAEELQDLCD